MRVMAEGLTLNPVLERAVQVSNWAGNLTQILHGTPPKDPYGWAAIPIVMKLFLLWIGDELRYALPYLDGTEKHQIQGLIAPPPPDALERIERLQTAGSRGAGRCRWSRSAWRGPGSTPDHAALDSRTDGAVGSIERQRGSAAQVASSGIFFSAASTTGRCGFSVGSCSSTSSRSMARWGVMRSRSAFILRSARVPPTDVH